MEKELLSAEELWRGYLTDDKAQEQSRHLFGLLPSNPRCKLCNAPFKGIGGAVVKVLFGKTASRGNPNFCNTCEQFAVEHPGGAEIELTMLFADVRGSTTLAEKMSASEFTRLMNRFYATANDILIKTDAYIDKMVGDEVIGMFIPRFSGKDHARKAILAANDLLLATGHGRKEGPWVPVGVGVYTGTVYYGTVGSAEQVTSITAMGDGVNITARLASVAAKGEILIGEDTYRAAGLSLGNPERRLLELKGKNESVPVIVMRVAPE